MRQTSKIFNQNMLDNTSAVKHQKTIFIVYMIFILSSVYFHTSWQNDLAKIIVGIVNKFIQ